MKKIVFLAFCLIGLNLKAQVTPTGSVQIKKVYGPVLNDPNQKGYACTGDSITIAFTFTWSGTDNRNPMWNFHFTSTHDQYSTVGIRLFSYDEFYHLNKTLSSLDTIYSFKCHIDPNFSLMDELNQVLVQINLIDDSHHPGKNINVNKCYKAGLEEYSLNPDQKPIYYDFMGNRTEPVEGMWLVEWRGTSWRKILIGAQQ